MEHLACFTSRQKPVKHRLHLLLTLFCCQWQGPLLPLRPCVKSMKAPPLTNDKPIARCSIKRNILYGLEAADGVPEAEHPTDADVMEAAKLANAHDFIMAMPQGYETVGLQPELVSTAEQGPACWCNAVFVITWLGPETIRQWSDAVQLAPAGLLQRLSLLASAAVMQAVHVCPCCLAPLNFPFRQLSASSNLCKFGCICCCRTAVTRACSSQAARSSASQLRERWSADQHYCCLMRQVLAPAAFCMIRLVMLLHRQQPPAWLSSFFDHAHDDVGHHLGDPSGYTPVH